MRKIQSTQRKVYIAFIIVFFIVVFGTLGYHFILGWSFSDSIYMTLITVSTIGFGEVHPLNQDGKVFTIILILFGVGGVVYAFSILGEFIVEGQLRNVFRRKRMEKKSSKLSNHIIVCGFGRMGNIISQTLSERKVPFIVVEDNPQIVSIAEEKGFFAIEGDATSDDIMKKAGIQKARAVACVVDNDAENLYITLSARVLNPKVYIVARCSEETAEEKMYRAGANRVMSPYFVGAKQMADMILRPHVMEFFEMALGKKNLQLEMQEIKVPRDSFLDGVTLLESGIKPKFNLIVVGVKREGMHDMFFNPPVDFKIDSDDILVLIGEPSKMDALIASLKEK